MATIHDPTALTSTATKYLISTYYDKLYLERLVPNLRWYELCQKRTLPKGEGKVIKFSSYKNLAVGSKLTESTKPTPAVLSTFNVTATLMQYGGYAAVSDFLEDTAISSVVTEAIDVLSEQSALTMDTHLSKIACGGAGLFPSATSRLSAMFRFRGTGSVSRLSACNGQVLGFTVQLIKAVSSGVTKNLSGMGNNTTSAWASYKMCLRDVRAAVGTLRTRNVPPMSDGYYLAIAHPTALQQLADDTQTTGWTDWQKYTTAEPMLKGEVGRAEGVRFISSTNAVDRWICSGAGYTNFSFVTIVGKNALGCIAYDGVGDTKNSKNPTSLIIKRANQYDMSDPLDQTAATIGWKFTIAGAVLNTSAGIHLMTLRRV